ncbi:CYTH and CHAD domain-containing protein [Eleftheria terrae]|uniref:CYTH and CHAD domain-containing protein n=1 Tax=Eleftheria terrae TaxID=1597781 RepID=UPI00263A7876|nr:CYTH and CHAD domain-containing protein [Eleftheria terrae]WKB54967.1 CYTH and CHAD domain-containing protein [Eleftheria terrae]
MHELELKFQVPPEARDRVEAAVHRGGCASTRLQARYFDTEDGRLARAGLSLRLRREGRLWVQTLKADGDSPVRRLEHEVEVHPAARGEPPAIDPALHAGTPAGERLKAALQPDPPGPRAEPPMLLPRYSTDITRQTRELRVPGGGRVQLAFDEGRLQAGGRTLPVCELELELLQGPVAALMKVGRRWALQHGLWLSVVSKGQRGERLARGKDLGPVLKARPPRLPHPASGDAELRAVVAACLEQILGNASEVGQDRYNEDHVHQLRVGIRRLRSALRELGSLSAEVRPDWEAPLVKAFQALGDYRDRDTVLRSVRPQLQEAGAPLVELPPAATAADPAQAVREAGFQAALLGLIEFSLAEPAGGEAPHASRTTRREAAARLRRLHRQVVRDGRRFTRLDVPAQHRVRKRLKRLRYLAEFVAPLFGERAVAAYLDRLRPAQDALGLHNDDAVALEHYRAAAASEPAAWFAVGWLTAHREVSARLCRKALRKVADAPRFWKS